ncbi:hypothetical protein AVEN_66060-1 [Araneus ventricosus]|uniref:Uncharacterized protein n=1 Tax=Araneus ventricosus TaxID=182803 RepID=A0A4Y2PBH7_ARAVE|nr:hypothetical protein AVEN_66060-1 [Araneus ventricosus]
MPFRREERISIILLAVSGTTLHVARTSIETHRTQTTQNTAAKLMKFKRTGSVTDTIESGKPKLATDVGTSSDGQESGPVPLEVALRKWKSIKAVSSAICGPTSGTSCRCCNIRKRTILTVG